MASVELTASEVERLLEAWQARMGLGRWEIKLDLENPSRECGSDYAWASVWRSTTYETAEIRLHPDWRAWPIEKAELHLVHELVHLWLRDLESVLDLVDEQVPPAVDRALQSAFDQRLETAVDVIARRLIGIQREAP